MKSSPSEHGYGNDMESVVMMSHIAEKGDHMSVRHSAGELAAQDEIARLAYAFYEARGRQDGHDLEDWLAAERKVMSPSRS